MKKYSLDNYKSCCTYTIKYYELDALIVYERTKEPFTIIAIDEQIMKRHNLSIMPLFPFADVDNIHITLQKIIRDDFNNCGFRIVHNNQLYKEVLSLTQILKQLEYEVSI